MQNIEINEAQCDVNIFLEHIHEQYLKLGSKNILFPNIEWLNKRDLSLLNKIDLICCKNKHSLQTLTKMFPKQKIVHTGFTSIDRYNEKIPKKHDYFLHLKGISKYKNSQILVDTWLKHPEWPTLVVVHHGNMQGNGSLHFNIPFKVSKNILVYQTKVNDNMLQSIMNQCATHICCSFSEGFGHYINEGRSTGAFLLTTNGNPMKEFLKNDQAGMLIQASKTINVNCGEGYFIDSESIEKVINCAIHIPGKILIKKGLQNRSDYIKDKEMFYTKLQKEIKNLY
jgi:glycosyltransferase involved in cell wall biosynthesis